jgi:hypothetical protein
MFGGAFHFVDVFGSAFYSGDVFGSAVFCVTCMDYKKMIAIFEALIFSDVNSLTATRVPVGTKNSRLIAFIRKNKYLKYKIHKHNPNTNITTMASFPPLQRRNFFSFT